MRKVPRVMPGLVLAPRFFAVLATALSRFSIFTAAIGQGTPEAKAVTANSETIRRGIGAGRCALYLESSSCSS